MRMTERLTQTRKPSNPKLLAACRSLLMIQNAVYQRNAFRYLERRDFINECQMAIQKTGETDTPEDQNKKPGMSCLPIEWSI